MLTLILLIFLSRKCHLLITYAEYIQIPFRLIVSQKQVLYIMSPDQTSPHVVFNKG